MNTNVWIRSFYSLLPLIWNLISVLYFHHMPTDISYLSMAWSLWYSKVAPITGVVQEGPFWFRWHVSSWSYLSSLLRTRFSISKLCPPAYQEAQLLLPVLPISSHCPWSNNLRISIFKTPLLLSYRDLPHCLSQSRVWAGTGLPHCPHLSRETLWAFASLTAWDQHDAKLEDSEESWMIVTFTPQTLTPVSRR